MSKRYTFTELRHHSQEARKYQPGMEEEDHEIPILILVLAFLAMVGAVCVIYLGVELAAWIYSTLLNHNN